MKKIEREKAVVAQMIALYCRRAEGNEALCDKCRELLAYASERLDRCPFGERKKACKKCPVHCYASRHREGIRVVMRYAGPRMIFYKPWAALWHLFGR